MKDDDEEEDMMAALMGGKHHKQPKQHSPSFAELASGSDPDSTSADSYLTPLPTWNAPYNPATTSGASQDPNFIKGILEQEADVPTTDYSSNYGDAGHDTLISGTTDSVQGIIDSQKGDDTSQDFNPNLPAYTPPKLDSDTLDLTGFKMPRIEGIDDEPVNKPQQSQAAQISNGLFGMGKPGQKVDFSDQADDVLAETFDADIEAAQKAKKLELQQKQALQQDQDDMFDDAFQSLGKSLVQGGKPAGSKIKNAEVEMQMQEDKQLVDLFADGKGLEDDE